MNNMKNDYIKPEAIMIPIKGPEQHFCVSGDLDPLQESNDLEGFDWDYN